jgi:aldose 1-epimerase
MAALFGRMPDGREVRSFTLANGRLEVVAVEYGAAIVSLRAPDRQGRMADVVLGFGDLAGYLSCTAYLGVVVGRYANRIAAGRFTLDGRTYTLETNDGPNHLHGGRRGFHTARFAGEALAGPDGPGVAFSYVSPDGEAGYPGELRVRVSYTVTSRDELVVDFHAAADRPTVVNLAQHSYFNLAGEGSGDVLGHRLEIDADRYTPVDPTLIPTGELDPVAGTPFDFRAPKPVGADIEAPHEQLARAGGYDHNFVLRDGPGGLRRAARLTDPSTGRNLEVHTTEPGLQLYSGNFLDGRLVGRSGRPYTHRSGLCLETQHVPDSPNHPSFPSTVVRPGADYRSRTVFAFGYE